MGEVKQANFRINQETADAFRKFCEDNGMSQAQGFDHIMQVVELDRAKAAAPARATEIEDFEQSLKSIMSAYLYSLEVNHKAEARIREQFAADLAKKDNMIDNLRAKAGQLKAEKDAAEVAAAEAVKAKGQAEKAAAAAEKIRIAAEQSAADKQVIADTLAAKLAEAEKKAEGFDDLKAVLSDAQEARRAAEQRVKDAQRDAADAAKDAAREAERARAAEEMAQSYREEAAEARAKLDARTEELLLARQQAADAQILMQKEQARAAGLERQLKAAPAGGLGTGS